MLPPGVDAWTDTGNNEAWLAGKIGMTKNSFSLYGNMKRDTPEIYKDTLVMNRPRTKTGELLEAGGSAWLVIFKGAKNIDLAKEYCLYMLQPQVFNPIVKEGAGLFLPCYKNLYTDEMMSYDPNMPALKEIMFNPTDYKGFSHPAEPSSLHESISASTLLSSMMSNIVAGKVTPEQGVADAHKRIVQIWEEGGIKQ
jgi:multiple sugar transport system substrate-binding protein